MLNKCTSNTDKPIAMKILKEWGDIDIKKSIEFLEKWGGFCDCEIMMNVVKGEPCEVCHHKYIVVNPHSENDSDKLVCNACRKFHPLK